MLRYLRLTASLSHKLRSLRERRRARLRLEELESRTVPSVFTPAQIRHAYGFDQIAFSANGKSVAGDGSGQTIAIVDAFDAPNIQADLQTFDKQFNLPNITVQKANPSGVLPAADGGWAQETSLDVEWAHAIAPAAHILLVEATSDQLGDLLNAVSYAASQPGVAVVSMSWGTGEFSTQTLYDSVFTTPAGHGGVTFVASSGDSGAWYGVDWPASSPNVLSVGGTSLRVKDSLGTYYSETGWSGSTGGYSSFESQPAYQSGVQSSGARTTPDVAYDGNPNTGVYMYDSYSFNGQAGWFQIGGTSVGAPQWSALVAIADQGRALAGKGSLDGPTQTLPDLYSLAKSSYSTYFHDVTSGSNGYRATRGYDLVTGLGSPKANALVSGLVKSAGASVVAAVSTTSTSSSSNGSQTGSRPASSEPEHGKSPASSGGNQTPSAPSSSANVTTLVIVIAVNPAFASAAGVGAVQGPNSAAQATPTLPAADPRVVPLAVPGPRVADIRTESGGGNNPLTVTDQGQQDDTGDDSADVMVVLDLSPNAPRMAPGRMPAAVAQQSAAAWRQAAELCFASDSWSQVPSEAPAAAAVGEESGMDSMAAFVGLGVVLGSYWSAPASEEDRRRRDRLQG